MAHENARRAIIAEKRPTAAPQVTFTDRMVIELGGTAVELSHVGRNHSDNSIVMRLPKERILFAVDFIPVKSVGFRDWPDAYIEDWIESLRRVEAMDFDVLVPGHGPVGTKDDVRAFRVYMEELRDEVSVSPAMARASRRSSRPCSSPSTRAGVGTRTCSRSTWPACIATSSRTAGRTDSGIAPFRRAVERRDGAQPPSPVRGLEQIPWLYDATLALAERTGLRRWRERLCAGSPRARARPRLRHRTQPAAPPSGLGRR